MQDTLSLCIDVGGTKLEYSFVEQTAMGRNCILEGRLLCAEFSAFHDAFHWLLEQVPLPVNQVCIAAAGPVHNESILFTNLDWHIDVQEIRRNFGLKKVILVNDMTAVMWSLGSLAAADYVTVKYGDPQGDTNLVVAPGTGLGVGIGVHISSGMVCLPSEGGHVSFSPRTEIERDLLVFLSSDKQHICAESVCSGIGLGALFRFLSKDNPCDEKVDYHGLGPWLQQQVDGTGEYHALALQTYSLFFDILAEVCGNLAVTCLPRAGIYLTGGLMVKLSPFMDRERFMVRFLDRSIQKELLNSIPIYQISHKNAALVGCERLLSVKL